MGLSMKSLGSIGGAIAGSFFGNPAAGAAIGGSLGSMFGPSAERLANREYVQQKRDAIDMWNMQNAYNSPIAQMARLKEAGLNPMLVYSSGNVTGNSSSSIDLPTRPSTAKQSGASADSFINTMQDLFMSQQADGNDLDNQIKAAQLERLQLQNKQLTAAMNSGMVVSKGQSGQVTGVPVKYGKHYYTLSEDTPFTDATEISDKEDLPFSSSGALGSIGNFFYTVGRDIYGNGFYYPVMRYLERHKNDKYSSGDILY